MVEYNKVNAKLSDSQLNKLKTAANCFFWCFKNSV